MISTRQILNTLKTKKSFVTDKELAKDMGVTYGALTNWIARDSIQYEPVINYAIANNIDLNELFSDKQSVFNIRSTEMDEHVIKIVAEKFLYFAAEGGRLLTAPFAADLKELIVDYEKKVESMKETFKSKIGK